MHIQVLIVRRLIQTASAVQLTAALRIVIPAQTFITSGYFFNISTFIVYYVFNSTVNIFCTASTIALDNTFTWISGASYTYQV